MSVTTLGVAPRERTPVSEETAPEPRLRRFPVEGAFLFVFSTVLYLAAADFMVLHLHHMNGDAYSRVANAQYVIVSRDPHLGAIGFVWPPLPSLLDIPILALQHWFPFLASEAFAGSVEAALFSAGTVVLLNLGLRRADVILPVRWLLLAAWILNPMTALYATEGMSEAPFIFFAVASLLLFLLWTESRRSLHLALLGVSVGLGTLVRDEFVALAVVFGVGVALCSLRRGAGWREIETRVLLYALPVLFFFGLWIGSMWVLMHDPLYFVHSTYGNASQASVTNDFLAAQLGDFGKWPVAASFVLRQSLGLFPAVVVLVGALAFRTLVGRDRMPAIVLALLAAPIPLVDIYLLHAHQLNVSLRYQIFVIPYSVVVGIYLLRQIRRVVPHVASTVGLALVALLLASDVSAGFMMGNPVQAREESIAVKAITANESTGNVRPDFDFAQQGTVLSQQVVAADTDHGLIAMDTFRGFSIYMTASDRSIFVITSDEDFEASVNQPDVYHVEYFLVPQPVGEGALDRINQLYPTLWSNGGGFAVQVADLGGADHWRLFRIVRPTGRG